MAKTANVWSCAGEGGCNRRIFITSIMAALALVMVAIGQTMAPNHSFRGFATVSGKRFITGLKETKMERPPKKGHWRNHFHVDDATVLITGGAGFIGAHLAMKLRMKGHRVVALDNLNNYYDVRLKCMRKKLVEAAGATFITGDVCDSQMLASVFERFRFTHVVHLAAQAGVRYSKANPMAYGQANVMCTIALLEVIRNATQIPAFIYASSSSIYGRAAEIPFRESHRTDKPISIYAATKLATEHIAHAYHSLYGLRTTGLRFFTVYGPLGRPDMAAWTWAKRLLEGKSVTLYTTEGSLLRDFTYIDDIIDGIQRAIEFSADWAIFNLGRGQPQNVSEFLTHLSLALNTSGQILSAPLPPGDVPVTFADTSLARRYLGYQPSISIREGVGKFVSWFRTYKPQSLPKNFSYVKVEPNSDYFGVTGL